ncbi:MAG: SulP family inorganic anion transporter [Bacteroidetes bacterium]|nr:SulP family inorganic anion transporter [Bacteroidota bacterium]
MDFFKHWKKDLPAGLVVFLVAMPLCLGVALASEAPLMAGIIAGVIGGVVVTLASGSSLGVSGPAAGLVAIVLAAVADIGFEAFLTALVIAGLMQVALGYLRAGIIAYYFPASVIKGMLAGIGLIIILKQIPHALGYDKDYEGDLNYAQPDGETTFSAISEALHLVSPGAIVIFVVAMAILIVWEMPFMKRRAVFQVIQGPLVAVIAGIVMQRLFHGGYMAVEGEHLVNLPIATSITNFISQLNAPDFSAVSNYNVWVTAVTLALVASLETLLCVEATDKLDPHKRLTPTNRELKAQGLGNIASGLIGGLPITQVIVRSSANIQSGGESRLSALFHGILLLVSVLLIPGVLNLIPYASLAAVLVMVGYKLAKPAIFLEQYRRGWTAFAPFVVTIVVILRTDLLIGITVGMAVAIFFILVRHYRAPFFVHEETVDGVRLLTISLADDVSFLHKAGLSRALHNLPDFAKVTIDGRSARRIDDDVIDVLNDFLTTKKERSLEVTLLGLDANSLQPLTDLPANVPSHARAGYIPE